MAEKINAEERTTHIYALCEPTGEVRYVGKSDNPAHRYENHLSRSRNEDTYKARWINKLRTDGARPLLRILETIPLLTWQAREMYWIRHFKNAGCQLTNADDGGVGGLSRPKSEATRQKLSAANRGRKHSVETRRKISAANRGRTLSAESIEKGAAKRRGQKFSPETILKMSISKMGHSVSAETREKLRLGRLGKPRPKHVGAAVAEANRKRVWSEASRSKTSASLNATYAKTRKDTNTLELFP